MAQDTVARAQKPKVFISYSRKDMAFADRLESALQLRGVEPLIDRDEIYAFEDWWKRIEALIGQADTIIFVLSPEAVGSDVCRKEVAFAASLNKRFAPIVFRRVEDKSVPDELARLNFIFFDDEQRFDESLDRLTGALETNIDWVRQHTEFGEDARIWEAANRSQGLLLRSPTLEAAERWIASRPPNAPAPTVATQAFIVEGRRASTRRRNQLTAGLATGLVLALGLAGLAYWERGNAQKNEARAVHNEKIAEEQRTIAVHNEQRAVANEKIANDRRIENLKSDSLRTAVAAQQLVDENKPALAQAIALEGLPGPSAPDRPLLQESFKSLQRAVRADLSLVELSVPGENIMSGAFTPDGKFLLTGSHAGTLTVWDLADYSKRHVIKTEDDTITQIDISPDGKLALIAGIKKPAIYDIATGNAVIEFQRFENTYARTGRFSPDGSKFALGFQDNHARIYSTSSGALLHELSGPTDFAQAYSRRVASVWGSVGNSGSAADPIIWAVEEANWRISGGMTDVLFSPDGSLLATAGNGDAEGAARLFSVGDGSLVATLRGESLTNNYNNQRMAFSADGHMIAVAERDHKIRVWGSPSGQPIHTLVHTVDAACIVFDKTGQFLAVGFDDGSVRIWSMADGVLISVLAAHDGEVQAIQFSPGGQLLATASDDRSVRLWWNTLSIKECTKEDRQNCDSSMRLAATFRGHADTIQQILFSPDGKTLASLSRDETVRLWRTRDPGTETLSPVETKKDESIDTIGFVEPELGLEFSKDGKQLLAYNHFRRLTLWEIEGGKALCDIEGSRISHNPMDGMMQVHGSPTDARSADCSQAAEDSIANSELSLREKLEKKEKRSEPDYYWMISPDGTRAIVHQIVNQDESSISISDGDERQLIDVATGQSLTALKYYGRNPKKYYFSADGSTVIGALAGADKTDQQKEIDNGGEYAIWDTRTGRNLGSSGLFTVNFDLVGMSSTGRSFVLGSSRNSVVVSVSVKDGELPQWKRMQRQTRPVSAVGMCATGDQIAVSSDQSIALYDPGDGKLIATMFAGRNPLKKLLYSKDCRLLAGWDSGNTVWLWDLETRMALASVPQQISPLAIKFAPDGRHLAVQTIDAAVHVIMTDFGWLHLADPQDLTDWTRGSLSASLTANERQRFRLNDSDDKAINTLLIDLNPAVVAGPWSDDQLAELLKYATQIAYSLGVDGAASALRTVASAYDGKTANAAMQLALEIDRQASSPSDLELAYVYFQISQRLVRVSAPELVDENLRQRVEQRLRILPRQLSPPVLVKLFRAAREWSPK